MTAHTPGPWSWNAGYDKLTGAGGNMVLNSADYEGMWVCGVPFLEEGEANAFLIAAAPELLAALESLVNAPVRYSSNRIEIDCDSHGNAMKRMMDARAAIAKARG